MLLLTSFLGSVIGFIVCYRTISPPPQMTSTVRMRVCMLNSMSLAFLFAMLVELATGSKLLALVLPLMAVCVPLVVMMKPVRMLDAVESMSVSLMSTTMSIMLIGMTDTAVIFLLQCCLMAIEVMLYAAVVRGKAG